MMKERGVSINTDKFNVHVQKNGGAWKIDNASIPKELKFIKTGGPGHFEIAPAKAGVMSLETYQSLLKQIRLINFNIL